MNILAGKFKEVLLAVLPITGFVLLLSLGLIALEGHLLAKFLLGALLIIVGLTIFLFGVDLGVSPIGTMLGKKLLKSNRAWVIAVSGLVLGFLISIAEPDLHILAGQVSLVTAGAIPKLTIVSVVSLGIALFLAIGMLRIVSRVRLNHLLTVIYVLIGGLAVLTSAEFLAISFDASGATTGAMTVPFILALGLGVAALQKSGPASGEDSFGLVAVASAGAIIAVMLMSILSGGDKITGALEQHILPTASILQPFAAAMPVVGKEIFLAFLPLLLITLFFQFGLKAFTRRAFARILKGLLYTFIGLVLFLTGVNAGFMEIGSIVGYRLASLNQPWILVAAGFLLGLVTILAEPAVYVLTSQIEQVTSGYIKRTAVVAALSIGVAFAVSLSMLRIIVPGIKLWHYLLPGYLLSVVLSYYVPPLFVGIAFDSGGVASGPMTATFVLSFAQGAAEYMEGANVLADGFGVIAMVALTPLIALQLLGLVYQSKARKGRLEADGRQFADQ